MMRKGKLKGLPFVIQFIQNMGCVLVDYVIQLV